MPPALHDVKAKSAKGAYFDSRARLLVEKQVKVPVGASPFQPVRPWRLSLPAGAPQSPPARYPHTKRNKINIPAPTPIPPGPCAPVTMKSRRPPYKGTCSPSALIFTIPRIRVTPGRFHPTRGALWGGLGVGSGALWRRFGVAFFTPPFPLTNPQAPPQPTFTKIAPPPQP